ncbi:MAG: TolC family protein [Verrucomicrobia bacterium]|nr:TolC family protein [Verrucomicrobiota bacterium]
MVRLVRTKRALSQRFVWLGALLLLGLLTACGTKHYRSSADKDVYRILQDYDRAVLGRTNAFTIATPYSGRPPKEIAPEELIDARGATNRRALNVEEALRLAVANSREYQTQKEQLYLTALSLTGARHSFSPNFVAQSTGTLRGTGDETQTGTVNSQIGVSQLLKSGGRLSLALGNDLIRYFTGRFAGNPPVQVGNDSAINMLTVNLTQPLLRGFGKNDPTVEALTQAERNVVYAVRSFSLYQSQFAADVVQDYFSLLAQKATVRNNYTNYLRRVETTQYLEARSVDRVRKSDVDDAQVAELSARITYINSVSAYLTSLDNFKLRLGLPISEVITLDDADLRDLERTGLIPVEISREAAFRMAIARHMDVLNAIDRFEDSKRKVRLAADQLRPGLNFTGNASVSSEAPDDYANFDFDQARWSAGVSLDLPVDRLRERNSYRSALISFESQLRSVVATLDNFKNRIDRGLRTLEQERLNYLSRQENLRVAERLVDNRQMLLEAGRANIRDVREAQDSLIRAQNDLTLATVAYLGTRLDLLLDAGILLADEGRFWLTDPLTGKISPADRGRPPLEMPADRLIPPDDFLEPKP